MDFEFFINNVSIASAWIFSVWIFLRYSYIGGGILFFSIFSDHAYSLILVYSGEILFNGRGMDAPAWIQVARVLSILGHIVFPIGLFALIRDLKSQDVQTQSNNPS